MGRGRAAFKSAAEGGMSETIAIVTPAFAAERWMAGCAQSVLAQTDPDWEHWIVADDDKDYSAMLAKAGLRDPRQRFIRTGSMGAGVARARNAALDRIEAPYVAILDADDRF